MYVKKIKIFTHYNDIKIENMVNEFLAKEIELGLTILDIKYQMSSVDTKHSCLIYYTVPVKEN